MHRLVACAVLCSMALICVGGCTTVRVTRPRPQVHRDHTARVHVVHTHDRKRPDRREPEPEPKRTHRHDPPDHAPAHGWRRQHEDGDSHHPGRGHGGQGSKPVPPGQANISAEPDDADREQPAEAPGNSAGQGEDKSNDKSKGQGKAKGKGKGKGKSKGRGKAKDKGDDG